MLKKVTLEEALGWCGRWCQEKEEEIVRSVFGETESLDAIDILKKDGVSLHHKLWAVKRTEMIDDRLRLPFEYQCAYRAIELYDQHYPGNGQARHLVDIAKGCLDGDDEAKKELIDLAGDKEDYGDKLEAFIDSLVIIPEPFTSCEDMQNNRQGEHRELIMEAVRLAASRWICDMARTLAICGIQHEIIPSVRLSFGLVTALIITWNTEGDFVWDDVWSDNWDIAYQFQVDSLLHTLEQAA